MNKQSVQTIALIAFYIIVFAYIVACTFQTIENLSLLGATMFAFKPSFTVANLVRNDRRYSESDRIRNYGGLHTPAYRVLNHVSKALLDSGLYGVCTVMNSRAQYKHISYKSLFSVTIDHGYSAVTIGARTIFAVDEWTRTIYHIDSNGRLAACDYHQGYDMTDVIAQVSECVEVLADFYTADKLETIAQQERANDWFCYGADNLGVVKDQWNRATVKCWFIRPSKKSVEWTKFWAREMPNGSRQQKTTTGSHPSAYQVVIGSTAYWLPHSILSREWELHGGRAFKSDHALPYFQFNGTVDTIDLPVWWLEKTVGVDWSDNVEPIGRSEFFKTYINKPRRRWRR